MRNGREDHGCFSIYEKGVPTKVVAMGGRDLSPRTGRLERIASAEILDVASMRWQDLQDLPFAVNGNTGIESVTGPNLGFSVGGKSNAGTENRIIGLRKNQNGNYFWQELTTRLSTGRSYHAALQVPDSMVASCER